MPTQRPCSLSCALNSTPFPWRSPCLPCASSVGWHREEPSFAEWRRAHRLGWPPALPNSMYMTVFSAQIQTWETLG